MKKGFTLIELMICIAIVGIFVAIIWGNISNYTADNSKTVEAAKSYVKDLGIRDANVQCVAIDTNNDGYVSCTASYRNSDKLEFLAFECASSLSFNSGCRLSVPGR